MKWLQTFIGFLFLANNIFAAEYSNKLFIPFLEPNSQSNVIVTVSGSGKPCPTQYTNSISNTNLFTADERKTIGEALIKYRHVTTNVGPSGTVLVSFYRTNFITEPIYWVETNSWNARKTNQNLVSIFRYTNSDAEEEVWFSKGISAQYKDQIGNHRNVSINITGGGALLSLSERNASGRGIFVRLQNFLEPGTNWVNWSYKDADFSNGCLNEYMQTTNGLLLGKWLMWNPRNGDLILEAEAKEPYDWNRHRQMLQN